MASKIGHVQVTTVLYKEIALATSYEWMIIFLYRDTSHEEVKDDKKQYTSYEVV